MEEEKMDTAPQQGHKMSLEALSKEEIIHKYRGLLSIAKKAKQTKDEISEENRSLKEQLLQQETQKETDKKALLAMKELLEAYTENKLELTTQVTELQNQRKLDSENLERMSIEKESMKRQLVRLTEDNESLLTDVENMEGQLKQVSGLSKDQKQQIILLEKEVTQLKETELKNYELSNELKELKEKYKFVRDINTEQRQKFNCLKERFIEVHKKLKNLKECKRILLETQREYADAVSQWQNEIIKASKVLCVELNNLREENIKLLQKLNKKQVNKNYISVDKLNEILQLLKKVKYDYHSLQEENINLKNNLKSNETFAPLLENCAKKLNEMWHLSKTACQEYSHIQKENTMLKNNAKYKSQLECVSKDFCYIHASKLSEFIDLTTEVIKEYKSKLLEIETLKANFEKLKHKNQCFGMKNQKHNDFQHDCDYPDTNINFIEQEKHSFMKVIQELQSIPNYPDEERFKVSLDKLHKEYKQLSERLIGLKQESLSERDLRESLAIELEKVKKKNFVLEEKMQNLEKTASETEKQLESKQNLLEGYQKNNKHKEIEHCELLDEMRELNEALKARGDFISRQQEEYKILSIELKTNSDKLAEMQEEINSKDMQLNEKQTELETLQREKITTKQKLETLDHVNSTNEEKIRILSIELDNTKLSPSVTSMEFDNQSDILSTSTISRADELQRLKDVEDTFEDKYYKLRNMAAKLKKRLQEETNLKQKLEKGVQDLKKQEIELSAQVLEFKQKISDIDNQLNEKQKHIDSLKMENQKLKSSRKQTNVLNLEIEAAEKSLTEVTSKLANRTFELEAAQESLKSKDSAIAQLRREIDLLEASKSSEIKHSQELKLQIDHLHNTLKDEMHSKQQAYDKSKLLEQDLENLNLQLENVKLELARSTSNHDSVLKSLNFQREQLSMQLTTTEAALLDCEQKLSQAKRITEDLRVEYLDYKVKAQAVLRQNQNRDSSKERELEEEIINMRATETQLNTTIHTLTLKIESLEKQKYLLSDENSSLQKRSKELMALIEDIRIQNDALNQEIQQYIQQQHETLKQHRQQIESIDNCYKEQIQSLNSSHQMQLEQLRKELSQNIRIPISVGATKPMHADHSCDQSKLDFLLMEREDAEGSEESVETLANLASSRKISNDSSTVKRSVQDFIPLDELLNTPLNAINSETLITNTINTVNSVDFLQLELNSTKECLQKQESRVRHLTALLSENEQDLAKLTQMNDMLKEELRRQERSVEREQHMNNSEYVKNVILKFLTLNNADEKTRLVPVLNTILKLNRSETEMLNCVAKGQKVSETTQRTGSWGNFLPWSSSSSSNNNN